MLVGYMNAHLGGWGPFLGSACPLHGEACCTLQGGSCSRDRMLWSTLDAHAFFIPNGCTNMAMHTCTTRQQGGAIVHTMVYYLIANSMVLQMIDKIAIDNYLRCQQT